MNVSLSSTILFSYSIRTIKIQLTFSFSLPETVGKPLLQSLEEAEVYYECSKCDKNATEKFLEEKKTDPKS